MIVQGPAESQPGFIFKCVGAKKKPIQGWVF